MTTSIFQDIRGALQTRVLTVPVFPSKISYEGRLYSPVIGVPYASLVLKPTSGKPFSVDGDTTALRGLLLVDLYYPASGGSANVEIAGDSVISKFKSGTKLRCGSGLVLIDYAERADILAQDAWLHLPVTIGWRSFPSV